MDKETIINDLVNLIGPYLKNLGLELVDLIYRHEGQGLVLRILVDRPQGGIRIDECSRLNKDIGFLLDEKDLIPQGYFLEVSSPGLDRPLQKKEDFLRCIEKEVRVFLNTAVNSRIEYAGIVNKVENESVYIDIGNEVVQIPIAYINKGKRIID